MVDVKLGKSYQGPKILYQGAIEVADFESDIAVDNAF